MIDIERWYNRCLIQLKVDIDSERADIIRGALSLFAENPSWLAFVIADSEWMVKKRLLGGLDRAIKAGRALNAPVCSATQLVEDIQAELLHNKGKDPVLPVEIRYGQRLTPNTLEFLCFLGYGVICEDQALLWGEANGERQLETVDANSEDVVEGSEVNSEDEDARQYIEADFNDGEQYLQTDFEDLSKYTKAKAKAKAKANGTLQYIESDFEYTCQEIERGDFAEVNSLEMLALSYTNVRPSEIKESIGDWIDKLIAGELLAEPMNDGYKALYIEIIRGLVHDSTISANQLYKIIAKRLLDADEAGSNDGNLSAHDGVEVLSVPTLAIVRYKADGRWLYVKLKAFSNWVSILRKLVPVDNTIRSAE